jgi:eukaryotic-like serine/threonine-protein kinase
MRLGGGRDDRVGGAVTMTIPQRLADRYELGEIVGFGGMSEVHLARDLHLHRDVAVKVLRADLARDPASYLRFRREAQHAAALSHPAIVAVHDTGEAVTAAGKLPYIVMEYVDGVTLRDIVHTDGPMEPKRAIETIADACQALNFSHQHGIIHRDVKPANIMISKTGAVKVMDFGIARALADANSVTQTAAVIGTAQYLSPEQARGEKVDARSDVYSLGCVLYEILTGEPPFIGDSPVAVAYQHVREDPVPPSQRRAGISPELDAVVLKSLAKNPDNRYQTSAELHEDLLRVHSGQIPQAPKVLADEDGSPAGQRVRRGEDWDRLARGHSIARWLVAVAFLAVLTVAVLVAINLHGGGTSSAVVQVPDVKGRTLDQAVAVLQRIGLKVNPHRSNNAAVERDHVIDTNPGANAAVNAGSEVTVNVSDGPQQRDVPDVLGLSYADAVRKLKSVGFEKFKQQQAPSSPAQKNRVVGTTPVANQPSAITTEITISVGSGPATLRVPDVSQLSVDQATANLKTAGFGVVLTAPVDSLLPAGQVISTDPPPGTDLTVGSAVTLRVSRGNQFIMPDLTGKTYLELVPFLQSLGHVGPVLNGGDVPGPDQNRNRVVQQSPPAGTNLNRDGTITLNYGS